MYGFNYKMRIPTNVEYDRLMDITAEADFATHWKDLASLVDDPEAVAKHPDFRSYRGRNSARHNDLIPTDYRVVFAGFRPAFESLGNDTLSTGIADGDVVVIGTLYMDGEPVRVPQNPVHNGDVEDYIPGAKLKFGPALDDPAYQVQAIKCGDAFICDRCMLKNISYDDIEFSFVKTGVQELFDIIEAKCALAGYEVIGADDKGFFVTHHSEDRHFRIDITEMSA